MTLRFFVLCTFLFYLTLSSRAADSLFIRLHFVYGSRPKNAFKTMEKRYFGGIHGGHVYMEADDHIFSFGPDKGRWHIFGRKRRIVGCYRIDSNLVWSGDTGRLKMTTIVIPVNNMQMQQFKSVKQRYLDSSPYDYAFFGMRCAAAAYDVLSATGVCRKRSRLVVISRNFYPKRLRVKLLRRAAKEDWYIERQEGRNTRRWERD